MKVVVLANLRWVCLSPSLYQLSCSPNNSPVHLGFNGKVWFLSGQGAGGRDIVGTVPDRDTGAMMLAKQMNAQGAGSGT